MTLDQLPDGWDAATQLHHLEARLGPRARAAVTERAVDAVLARARRLLRHGRRPRRSVEAAWPAEGALALDATLERPRPWKPADLRVERSEPRDVDVVAILDMSLSMTGEKIALVAVAAAILRLKLDRVGVVAFDTDAQTLVPVGSALGVRELVRRVLLVPALGYTHIAAGLEEGLVQLRRSGRKERVGLLLSDGVSNVGADPVTLAGRYPTLHVVQLGRDLPQGGGACRAMAAAGHGQRFHAPSYVALPEVVRDLVRELFR